MIVERDAHQGSWSNNILVGSDGLLFGSPCVTQVKKATQIWIARDNRCAVHRLSSACRHERVQIQRRMEQKYRSMGRKPSLIGPTTNIICTRRGKLVTVRWIR